MATCYKFLAFVGGLAWGIGFHHITENQLKKNVSVFNLERKILEKKQKQIKLLNKRDRKTEP